MVVVVIYGCWLIRWCQSIVGRCGGKVSPFCRSWILVIFVACVITAITTFEVVIAAGLFKPVLVPPLLTVVVILQLHVSFKLRGVFVTPSTVSDKWSR